MGSDRLVPNAELSDVGASLGLVAARSRLAEPGWFVWGASVTRDDDGLCHMFYSRWPGSVGFQSWLTHSEIAHAVAADPLGPYEPRGVALPARGGGFWDGSTTHNPTVLRVGDRYCLYYTGNNGDGEIVRERHDLNWTHRNRQRIGVALADHPSGPWRRFDEPLIGPDPLPGGAGVLATTNPAVARRPDGGFLMVYKAIGSAKPLPKAGPVFHLAAFSDEPTGPFVTRPGPVFTREGSDFPAEDPCVWWSGDRYRAIVKDMDGSFSGLKKSLVLFESPDGVAWGPAEPCLVADRAVRHENGAVRRYDFLERPQVYLEDGTPRVLFCAALDGDRSFNLHIPIGRDGAAVGGAVGG